MTILVTTHADFDATSWHDNHLYGVSIEIGDIEAGDWRSDLVFDIDHIVDWVKADDGRIRFRVSPATLTFHDVTDLKLAIDWGDGQFQTAIQEASVDHIERERIADQKICFDRPYYRWQMLFNWPAGGEMTFGASGYTQTLRSEPVVHDEQKLKPGMRISPGGIR